MTDSRGSAHRSIASIIVASADSYTVVAGVPLLIRAAVSAQRADVSVVMVVADDPPRARHLLASNPRTRSIAVIASPASATTADGVMLIAGDCLVTPHTLAAARDAWDSSRIIAIGVAHQPDRYAVVIGAQAQLAELLRLIATGGNTESVALSLAPTAASVRVANRVDAQRAERALLDALRTATLDTDGPIARIDRAISLRVSRALVRTPLRPNHITIFGTAIGLLAAWALAHGSFWYGLLGACLFWAAVIIDGCDGEVARLKFLETRFGQLFDVITDNVVHVAIFAGLAIGAYRTGRIEHGLAFAATLIVGFLCASAATYFCLLNDGPVKRLEAHSARGRIRQRLLQVFEALMNRDFAYLLVLLAVIDRLHWFLWGTLFGTYGYALGLVLVYRWSDSATTERRRGPAIESSH